MVTIVAALVLIITAFAFIALNQSVVEVALGIASITYGGLLGTFLLGLISKKATERGAIAGFTAGIIMMVFVNLYPLLTGLKPLMHWTWFVLLGTVVTIIVGSLVSLKKN